MNKIIAASVATIIVAASSLAYSFPSIPKFGKKKVETTAIETSKASGGFDSIVIPALVTNGRFKKKPVADVIGDTRKFTGTSKVSVPTYKVSFDKKSGASASASSGNFGSGPNANASINATLTGVDEATFKRITNAAHQDFIAKLSAAGYEVLSMDAVNAAPSYQKWSASKYPKAGKGASVYLAEGQRYPGKITFGLKWNKLMNDTRAAIISPELSVNFASFGKSEDDNWGSGKASAKVSLGPSVHVFGAVNGSSLKTCDKLNRCYGDLIYTRLGQAAYSKKRFANINDATSKGFKAAQGVVNLFAGLQGTSTSNRAQMNVAANAAAYEVAALDALSQANTRFISMLKAGIKVK